MTEDEYFRLINDDYAFRAQMIKDGLGDPDMSETLKKELRYRRGSER